MATSLRQPKDEMRAPHTHQKVHDSRAEPDRANPREIAHFDSAPYNDNGPGFSSSESGAWSNYPFFGDGLVVFTSVREGLFIMRVTRPIT